MKGNLMEFMHQDFGAVRGIEINGEPWLVGKDVAKALGYKNSRDALSRHVDSEDKGVGNYDSLGGQQKTVIINEPASTPL